MLTISHYGESSILATDENNDVIDDLADKLITNSYPFITNVTSAGKALVVYFDPLVTDQEIIAALLLDLQKAPPLTARAPVTMDITLVLDGIDLNEVLLKTKYSLKEFANEIYGKSYQVGHLGFTPGFLYLNGLNPALNIHRRPTPRVNVPGGSVAIGGPYLGIYGRDAPGGWHIIGTTPAILFDISKQSPMLLRSRDQIRFIRKDRYEPHFANDNRDALSLHHEAARPDPPQWQHSRMISASGQVVFQDLGRFRYAHLGVGHSGAMDQIAYSLANEVLRNDHNATSIEIAFGHLSLEMLTNTYVAIAGAQCEVTIDGRSVGHNRVHGVLKGQRIDIRVANSNVYAYLATQGGFAAPLILGSTSRDTLSHIGPPPLQSNDFLGATPHGRPPFDTIKYESGKNNPQLSVTRGPNISSFSPSTYEWFFATQFEVSPTSSRSGIRLKSSVANPINSTPLTSSQPVTPGAIQLPTNGDPIVIGRDNPTTGGYPIIGCLSRSGLSRLSQLPPGSRVSFYPQDIQIQRDQESLFWAKQYKMLHGYRPVDEIIAINSSFR